MSRKTDIKKEQLKSNFITILQFGGVQMTKRELVESLIGEDLLFFASRHNYCAEFFRLFAANASKKKTTHMSKAIATKADRRSLEDYHREIGLAWVIEDYLVDISHGKFSLCGCDAERKFLTEQITNVGDLQDKQGRIYEVVADYSDNITKNGYINLRQNKLMHLREQDARIIIVDVKNKEFFIKNAKRFPFFKIENFKPFGGKDVYRIYLNDDTKKFKPIIQIA